MVMYLMCGGEILTYGRSTWADS